MSLLAIADHADLDKTRKSLFIAAIYTFLVANAEFLTDELSIFGLKVIFRQSDLVGVGRLSVLILLIVFTLHSFSIVLEILSRLKHTSFKLWEEQEKSEISEIEERMSNPDYDNHHYEPDPWIEGFQVERSEREKTVLLLKRANEIFGLVQQLITRYCLVLVASLAALLNPTIAGTLISYF